MQALNNPLQKNAARDGGQQVRLLDLTNDDSDDSSEDLTSKSKGRGKGSRGGRGSRGSRGSRAKGKTDVRN